MLSSESESNGKPLIGEGRCMSIQAMHELNSLRENSQLCDATILLEDGTKIPVHRAVMCACSNYFKYVASTL